MFITPMSKFAEEERERDKNNQVTPAAQLFIRNFIRRRLSQSLATNRADFMQMTLPAAEAGHSRALCRVHLLIFS